MNEMVNNEVMEMEFEDVREVSEDVATTSGGKGGIVAIVGGLLLAGGALVWHKTKGIRERHAIKKLEKAGYIVSKIEDVEYTEAEVENNAED